MATNYHSGVTDHRAGTPRDLPLPPPAAGDLPARLMEIVRRAAEQARRTGAPTLASVGEPAACDPLGALVAAEQGGDDPRLSGLVQDGRMFWAHPRSRIAIAGIGAAATIAPAGARRFTRADASWRAMLASALVDDGGAGGRAAGPLLLGGFSFEPDGPRWAMWADFPATHLVVPALQLTSEHGTARLTLNTIVTPEGEARPSVEALLALRAQVLACSATEPDDATPAGEPLQLTGLRDAADWRSLVAQAVDTIGRGVLDKVVLARAVRTALPAPVSVPALLAGLRAAHGDSYVFACWRGERVFVGASPERLVRVAGREVDASSLAGSAPRGATPAEDAALAAGLRGSAKDLAEHAMVRSALGEALGGLCDDVASPDGPSLLTLPHVHHLHTAVHARLREGRSLLELAGALHPTPAVGGTPREAALAFIREHEQLDRGWYAAPIGWIGRDGGELAVALRSALLGPAGATLFAGCGIVAGSDAAGELEESRLKLRPMATALAAARALSPAGA
jgi:isochorismate synthase